AWRARYDSTMASTLWTRSIGEPQPARRRVNDRARVLRRPATRPDMKTIAMAARTQGVTVGSRNTIRAGSTARRGGRGCRALENVKTRLGGAMTTIKRSAWALITLGGILSARPLATQQPPSLAQELQTNAEIFFADAHSVQTWRPLSARLTEASRSELYTTD